MNRPMKDSGIEWIGEIPENWDTLKVKYASYLKGRIGWQGLTSDEYQDDGPFLITGKDFANGSINWSSCTHITNERYEEAPDIHVQNNDLLITKDGTIGKIAIISDLDMPASLNSGVLLIRKTSERYVERFLYHVLNSDIFWKWYNLIKSPNSTILHLYQNDFKDFSYPVPPLLEQRRIACFLDEKTEQIESILENTKQSIVELKKYKQAIITETVTNGLDPCAKMKDSGIKWIGEIPEHCNLKKIKILASKIGSGKTPRGGASVYSETGILFLRSQNIYDTGLYLKESTYISEEIDEEMRNTRVYPNDVLLNITGASIGRCCIYPANLKQHANVNQHVCIIRPIKNKITPQFLFYFLNSNAGQSAINYYQTGGNREGLNFEQIGNIHIPLYSISEQQQITDYLDEKCAHIDSLISDKEKLISEFEDYKKALIYEYVTGKKEVE